MNIGIDISQTAYKGTGVARYTQNMVRALLEHDKKNTYKLFFSSLRGKLPQDLQTGVTAPHSITHSLIPPTILSGLWNDLHVYPVENFVGDVDIFISSDWTQPPTKKAKRITIIHDLVVYLYPETSHPTIIKTQKKRLQRVVEECEQIITDSKSTKKDIINILGVGENKIHVVYPYVEAPHNKIDATQVLEKFNLKRPYVLAVGKIEPRKNLRRAIEAFKNSAIPNLDLVIAGADGWGDLENSSDNVIMLGHVSDDELWALYKEAEILLYPSLYEGFGYPVVEAMAAGTPVITSNISSLPEIAGSAATLCNPESTDDISDKLKKLYYNQKERDEHIREGYKQVNKFSKEKFAQKFVQVLESL